MTIRLQIWVDCSSGQNVVQTLVQNPSRSSLALPVQSIRFLLVSPKINKAKSARSFSVGVLCGVVAYRLTYGSTCGIAVAPMVLYASQTQRILYVVRRSSIVRMMLIEVRVSNWKFTRKGRITCNRIFSKQQRAGTDSRVGTQRQDEIVGMVEQGATFALFSHLISPLILRALEDLGFSRPTLVQQKAIPFALENHDILARARTGSGKTAAYCIPLVQKILNAKAAAAVGALGAYLVVQVLLSSPCCSLALGRGRFAAAVY